MTIKKLANYQIGLIIVLVSLFLVSSVNKASAHTLAKDGRISAFMHIDPTDNPQPGKINTVHFYFNDQDFRFTMEGCDCNVKVSQGKKTLYKGVLPASAPRVGIIKVFLPVNNFSYDVVVNGTPKTAGFFQPFKLVFDIDVGNPPADKPVPKKNTTTFISAGLIILVAGGVIYYLRKRKFTRIKD